MRFLYKLSVAALFIYLTWKFYVYHVHIVPWVMHNIMQFSEHTASRNANEPIAAVIVYMVLLFLSLALMRVLEHLIPAMLPPSMRPSLGALLAVPPVNPRVTTTSATIMTVSVVALIYLLII